MSRSTKYDATQEIGRLASAGYRVPDVGAEAIAESWVEHMDGVWHEDVQAGVTAYIRGPDSRWPSVGKILHLAIEARRARPHVPGEVRGLSGEYWAWERHEHDDKAHDKYLRERDAGGPGGPICQQCRTGCPVCRAPLEWGPWGLRAIHDQHEHERAAIGWIGWSKADAAWYSGMEQAKADRKRDGQIQRASVNRAEWLTQQREQVAGLMEER